MSTFTSGGCGCPGSRPGARALAWDLRSGLADPVVVGKNRTAIRGHINPGAAYVVDPVLLVDPATALSQIDAVHLVVDAVVTHSRVATCLALHPILLVAVDVV